jgi:hypothetical protein
LKTNGAKLDLLAKVSDTDVSPKPPTATIAATTANAAVAAFDVTGLKVGIIDKWEESYVNYKGFKFSPTAGFTWDDTAGTGLAPYSMTFDEKVAVSGGDAAITVLPKGKYIVFGGGMSVTGTYDLIIGNAAGTTEAAGTAKIEGDITFNETVSLAQNLVINGAKGKVLFDSVTNAVGVTIEHSYVQAASGGAKSIGVSFGETKEADPDTKLITPKVLTASGATVNIENSYVSVEDAIFSNASAVVRVIKESSLTISGIVDFSGGTAPKLNIDASGDTAFSSLLGDATKKRTGGTPTPVNNSVPTIVGSAAALEVNSASNTGSLATLFEGVTISGGLYTKTAGAIGDQSTYSGTAWSAFAAP